ncbi:MAG: hypothetical protein LBP28_02920 [Coriobacteriales bacterium]|jgi:hypothetical protein|nr:hypothetical protein [Coriobacteriales bacterium]
MDQDLIVVDSELGGDVARAVEIMADNLTEAIARYDAILNYVMQQAICDELLRSRLQNMQAQLKPLCEPLQIIKSSCTSGLRKFVSEIDRADEALY